MGVAFTVYSGDKSARFRGHASSSSCSFRISLSRTYERQGEVLEIDIEAELARRFPRDVIVPVAKGARGPHLVDEVRDGILRVRGTIVWEIKNTRHWQPA